MVEYECQERFFFNLKKGLLRLYSHSILVFNIGVYNI